MQCPRCASEQLLKNGVRRLKSGEPVQHYRCKACQKWFNERAGTPMHRLRTPVALVEMALQARSEGLGVRATGRVVGKAHDRIRTWEARLAAQAEQWSPPVPSSSVTVESDELYTKVERNRPAHDSEG